MYIYLQITKAIRFLYPLNSFYKSYIKNLDQALFLLLQ